jgi:hypothetical protein
VAPPAAVRGAAPGSAAQHVHLDVRADGQKPDLAIDAVQADAEEFWSPTEAGLLDRDRADARCDEMPQLVKHDRGEKAQREIDEELHFLVAQKHCQLFFEIL